MSVLRRFLLCVSLIGALFALSAQRPASALSTEDVLFEIVGYYNPTLAEAQPLVHCIAQGSAVNGCAQQFLQGEALQDPNVQRMLRVMNAYKSGDYPEMISLAGVGVACAWIDNPPVVCSEFAQVVVDLGAAAINAQIEVAGAVAELFTGTAKTVGCWTGIYCDDDDDEPGNQFNATGEWQRCYRPRVQEGLIARLYGGDAYGRLIARQTPAHRFSAASLLGACYPFVAVPDFQFSRTLSANVLRNIANAPQPLPGPAEAFTDVWNTANPWGAQPDAIPAQADWATPFSDFVAYASAPLSDQYEEIVENAAIASLEEPAQDYANLQGIWQVRAVLQGVSAFVGVIETRGQLVSLSLDGRATRQRRDCLEALSTGDAHMIERWADTGARIQSSSAVRGITAANWSARSPIGWCDGTYVPAFRAEAQRRLTAYDHALSQGCTTVRDDRFSLTCPLIGSGMANCQVAFQGVQRGHCARATLDVRIIPQAPPNSGDTPPAATTTAPPESEQPQVRPAPIRPGILLPPVTTAPQQTEQRPPG